MTIAAIGATGNTGRAVVKELRALGQNPVCVVRDTDKAREVLGRDAKTAVAELTDRPALEKALAGVQSVFVVTGHNPSMAEQQSNVLDAALKAGAQWYGSAAAAPWPRRIQNRWWAAATPPSRSGSRQAASNG